MTIADEDDDLIVEMPDLDDDDEIDDEGPITVADLTDGEPEESEDGDGETGPDSEDADGDAAPLPADAMARLQDAEARVQAAEIEKIASIADAMASASDDKRNAAKVALETLDFKHKQASRSLAVARDEGEIEKAIDLEAALREMDSLRSQINSGLRELPTRDQIINHARNEIGKIQTRGPAGVAVGSNIKAINPVAQRWATANTWMKTNERANSFVIAQSGEMAKNGWDANSPSFYAELTRRMRSAFPHLKVQPLQAQKKKPLGADQQKKSLVAPTKSSSSTGQPASQLVSKTKYKMTTDDLKAMRRMNLNPQDPTHRKYWAKGRIERARSSAQ